MYARILVPLDGSELAVQVLPLARIIGKALQSRIELLRVVEPARRELASHEHRLYVEEIAAHVRSEAKDSMDRLAAPLRADGLAVSDAVQEGDPAPCIVNEASRTPATLIAMCTHGRSGVSRWMLGSVTDKVLHATTGPLLIVRAREPAGVAAEGKLNTVIVPLDGSAVAEQILPHVVALAKALAVTVLCVKVTPSLADYYRYGDYYGYGDYSVRPQEDVSKQVDAEAVSYLQEVSQKLRQHGVSQVEERLLHGHPAAAIVDLAKGLPDSLVAMTTHGRSGVGRWILGSVADRVVRHSGEPVLLIRAAGVSE